MKTKGESLIEIILIFSLLAFILPVLFYAMMTSQNEKGQQNQRLSATGILKETEEAVRSFREKDWATFSQNGTFHPVVLIDKSWSLTNSPAGVETLANGFTRSVVISDVTRDANGNIIDGGTLDPSTKKVVITVSWTKPISNSIVSTLYLTRHTNISFTHTLQADFQPGYPTDTVITNTTGGEIILGPGLGGHAKWCEPSFSPQSVDLPEIPTAVAASPGHVYVSMGNSSSHTASFAHILVGTDPLTFTLHGRLNNNYQTTAVFGESNYGYIALNNTNNKRVIIIDLNTYSDPVNKIYTESGYYNLTGYSYPASSIFVFNNRGYVTIGGYLYVFDLSLKTGSRSIIGSRILFSNSDGSSPAKETFVRQIGSKTYVFVAIDGSYGYELSIIDVTKESTPNKQWGEVGHVDIDSNHCSSLQKTKGVYVKPDGKRAYISDANANDFKEFFVINTETKTNPFVVGGNPPYPACTGGGGWESGGMDPKQSAVTLPLENRAIIVGTGGSEQYTVLDVATDETHPVRCGGLGYSQGLYGIASAQQNNGDVYAFLITGNTSQDLKVIQGGADIIGGLYAVTGTYESATFDATYTVAFNRFYANATLPTTTNITYQIAIKDANPSTGNCTDLTFDNYVGPDGTSATSFPSTGGIIPFSSSGSFKNPGRCFRYKATLTPSTDANQTPVLNDITVSYSP
jgi:hypothetical protein